MYLDVSGQHALGHGVFQQPHDGATQWSCTVGWVVALIHQAVLESLCHINLDALVLRTLEYL